LAGINLEDIQLRAAAKDLAATINKCFGADYVELDKATKVSFNRLSFHPYFKFQIGPAKKLTLRLDETEFRANDFFSSLPAGLFTVLAGIQTSGDLAYHFNFFIDFSRPETLTLASGLEKRDFKIEHFGRVDFRSVNAPFLYTTYEEGRHV